MFWKMRNIHHSGLCRWLFRFRRIRNKAKLSILLLCIFALYSGSMLPIILSEDEGSIAGELSNNWPIARSNVTVFLTAAHLDLREKVGENPHNVRILAYLPDYSKFQFISERLFCQIHLRRTSICLRRPAKVTILSSTSKEAQVRSYEIMINCAISEGEVYLGKSSASCVSASLGESCNRIKLMSNCVQIKKTVAPPPADSISSTNFAVCLVAQNLKTILQHRLEHFVEFLEINKILGVERIDLLVSRRVPRKWWDKIDIDHGDKRIFRFSEYGELFDLCKDCISILTNDCIYRNMFTHDYVLVLDGLEVLFPRDGKFFNWKKMMEALELIHNATNIGAFSFQTIELFDESSNATSSYSSIGNPLKYKLPRIVTHRLRERNITGSSHSRYLLKTDQVVHVTKTHAVKLSPGYSRLSVPVTFGAVHIFSNRKPKYHKDVFFIDSSMDRFVPRLLQALHRHFYR